MLVWRVSSYAGLQSRSCKHTCTSHHCGYASCCRLIPFAGTAELMGKNCKLAFALTPQGDLKDHTVVVLLNDTAVSDTKETLSVKDAGLGTQERW